MVWGRAETYVIVAMEELTASSPWTGRHKAQAAMKQRIKLVRNCSNPGTWPWLFDWTRREESCVRCLWVVMWYFDN